MPKAIVVLPEVRRQLQLHIGNSTCKRPTDNSRSWKGGAAVRARLILFLVFAVALAAIAAGSYTGF